MSSRKTATGLERQHAFRSFKERVDLLRIEPARQLSVRAADFVETSYFLVTLEHWKEVNVSGNFTEFCYKVERLCQTLPSILHHHQTIYDALEEHVRVLDSNSLQPMMELMTQFIHDLGPDFMIYYNRFLAMIIEISSKVLPSDAHNGRNSSNLLEWTFNTLAYAFKYLARTLVADLRPTFSQLVPVFEMAKKTYMARFCAEALSFLVKKLPPPALDLLVHLSLTENRILLEQNVQYREAMVTLYSEAMKNTRGTFHSKAGAVFSILLVNALHAECENNSSIDVLCDVVLAVMEHGSIDDCGKFYCAATAHLVEVATDNILMIRLRSVAHVLSALCFAESGTKVLHWDNIFGVVTVITNNFDSLEDGSSSDASAALASLACLFATIVRNCDIGILARKFSSMAEYLISKNQSEEYLSFYEMILTNSKERALGFGATQLLQTVLINASSDEILARFSLLLMKLEPIYPQIREEISLPRNIGMQIMQSLLKDNTTLANDISLLSVFWKLTLVQYSSDLLDTAILVDLLKVLTKVEQREPCFRHDVIGIALAAAVRASNQAHLDQLHTIFLDSISTCKQSLDFLAASLELLKKVDKSVQSEPLNTVVTTLSRNFSLPDVRIRTQTARLITAIYACADRETSFTVSHIGIIDNIPLLVESANNIKMRVRLMFEEFQSLKGLNHVDYIQFSQYVIGLLTNNFQPCWQAVNENIGQVAGMNGAEEFWVVFYGILTTDLERSSFSYWRGEVPYRSDPSPLMRQFQSCNSRFQKYLDDLALVLVKNLQVGFEMHSCILDSRPTLTYSTLLRNRVLQALKSLPSVAEKHGSEAISLFMKVQGEALWSTRDKLALLAVFPKFKRIQRFRNSDEFYSVMMVLLSSKDVTVQRAALEVLFSWQKQEINKYRDNLTNLLDDKLFRDELLSLVSKELESKIEEDDRASVVPLVLRILYGRAKGVTNHNSKSRHKFAIATVLPNLPDKYILLFLKITAERFPEKYNPEMLFEPKQNDLRAMVGYLNMLYEIYVGLGYKFAHVILSTIDPLLYALISAQRALEMKTDDEIFTKTARTVRLLSFKNLNHLFKITCKSYDWEKEATVIYEQVIKPRLAKFSAENAQQPSAMMQMMLGWINAPQLVLFYFYENYAPVHAIVSLICSPFIKNEVLMQLLDFCIAAFTQKDIHTDAFYTVLAILVDGLLSVLPSIIKSSEDKDINSRAATLLLLIIEGKYVESDKTIREMVEACLLALDKSSLQISISDKVSILLSVASLVQDIQCKVELQDMKDLERLYDTSSKLLRIYKDRNMRTALVKLFLVFGEKFPKLENVSSLLAALNSFSDKRIIEPDYEKRMQAYRDLNETQYALLSVREWMPLIYSNLFFINDPDEFAIRSNASHSLIRYIDCVNLQKGGTQYMQFWNTVIVPYLRAGLKKNVEEIRDGYINVVAHAVRNSAHMPDMASMQSLLSDDPEVDFFVGINHVQISQRQKAFRTLELHRNDVGHDALFHYLLPVTEVYTICSHDRYLPLWNDVNDLWLQVTPCLKWRDFRQLFRKHIGAAGRAGVDQMRDRCRIVVSILRGLKTAFGNLRVSANKDVFQDMPEEISAVHDQIMNDFLNPIMNILKVRDDETIVHRVPLVEAAVNCLLCVSDSTAEALIAGVLTTTCQALRSRTQHIRDAVRKSLCRAAKVLGAKYFRFIVSELKSALSRGAQIHTLSYTLNAILVSMKDLFDTGDLNDSATLIVDIIMEDIFGAAGQEKDAEGYVSKMIEVASKKSYESAEVLSSNIDFTHFRAIVDPIKALMRENLPHKTRKSLDELIRRYAVGLRFNRHALEMSVLILCHELLQELTKEANDPQENKGKGPKGANDDHFLVQLRARPARMATDSSQVVYMLQTLSYELMRTALGRHKQLCTVGNLDGFFSLFSSSLELDNESVLCALFKVLNLVVTLPFPVQKDDFFEKAALKAFHVIQDLPLTSSILSQIMLRFLAAIMRYKSSIQLDHSTISYLLVRVMPDLEEPHRQSLAYNFLKTVVLQHILLPEVYDVLDKVSHIMILNQTLEIRAMARGSYFQFLMEYELGAQKLEKSFKFLVDNLSYPTEDGRLSVMEFLHSLVLKSTPALLDQLSVSFFVGLAHVLVSDDAKKCRELSSELIGQILIKSENSEKLPIMQDLIYQWIMQEGNVLLRRCGLMVYRVYLDKFRYGASPKLDTAAIRLITLCLQRAKTSSDGTASWEEVYMCLNVLLALCKEKGLAFGSNFEVIWGNVFETLLFPHSWVRLNASRLVGAFLSSREVGFQTTDQNIQTIAYRLLRQLAAPVVSSELATQVVKNMVMIITKWEKDETLYIERKDEESNETKKEEPENQDAAETKVRYAFATDFAVDRISKIMRQDKKHQASNASSAVTAAVQLAAMLSQILKAERLSEVAPKIIMGLYMIVENRAYTDEEQELLTLGQECLKLLETNLGTTLFSEVYTQVKIQVNKRREQRRAEKALLALTAPEVSARRKIKKHERIREKRKHVRDDKGMYRAKRKHPIQ